mmetsp:Transcript_24549/g.80151  ORF Transcript_24549/g.80151 Transcript_24549/m.80151 type:complete len:352 (-) Transcript_24549:888-1943(-)
MAHRQLQRRDGGRREKLCRHLDLPHRRQHPSVPARGDSGHLCAATRPQQPLWLRAPFGQARLSALDQHARRGRLAHGALGAHDHRLRARVGGGALEAARGGEPGRHVRAHRLSVADVGVRRGLDHSGIRRAALPPDQARRRGGQLVRARGHHQPLWRDGPSRGGRLFVRPRRRGALRPLPNRRLVLLLRRRRPQIAADHATAGGGGHHARPGHRLPGRHLVRRHRAHQRQLQRAQQPVRGALRARGGRRRGGARFGRERLRFRRRIPFPARASRQQHARPQILRRLEPRHEPQGVRARRNLAAVHEREQIRNRHPSGVCRQRRLLLGRRHHRRPARVQSGRRAHEHRPMRR